MPDIADNYDERQSLKLLADDELVRLLKANRPVAATISRSGEFPVWDATLWMRVRKELQNRGYDLDRSGELVKVVDEDEKAVLDALADCDWDFRTIRGIAKTTGLSEERVESILSKYQRSVVRESAVPDRKGRRLFTLGIRPLTGDEKWGLARAFVTKST